MKKQTQRIKSSIQQSYEWFRQHRMQFPDGFKPTQGQRCFIQEHLGREVSEQQWEAVFPPLEKEVAGEKYIWKVGINITSVYKKEMILCLLY